MIVLAGADLVLPDRIVSPGTLVIDAGRIADIRTDAGGALHGCCIVPGWVDVHVHGVEGVDVLDGPQAVAAIASRLPRYGVTAFCPTTVACGPEALRRTFAQVREWRAAHDPRSARVLSVHLESNFINPEYRGAQPAACLRRPRDAFQGAAAVCSPSTRTAHEDFSAADLMHEIASAAPEVATVTLAPELEGALDVIAWLTTRGYRVSLGHSSATFEQALAAAAAGARQATHLFNRMPPVHHRAPGLAGAVLSLEELAAELICDGVHVHPALVRMAIAAKGPSRILAITDATAGAGLPVGSRATLGGQPIAVGETAACLDDGTLAGSTTTMDRVFRTLVGPVGVSLVDAATVCATTPARELGLAGHGVLAVGAAADLVVLDAELRVEQTYVGGELVYSRGPAD